MPSKPITVILNFDQSRKFVFLIPDGPDGRKNLNQRILREGRNKFRLKWLTSIFLQGGSLLEDQADFPDNATQVWLGKGEPYAGPPERAVEDEGCRPEDLRIIGAKSFIDDSAVKQLEKVAHLPGVRVAVGMPDLHPGNRFPIGCAIASEGIYPALIGSDVGCGIALYRLSASASRARSNPRKIASLLTGLDEPWSGSVSEWLARYGITQTSEFDKSSLGTVGSGNHFAEICTPERIVDQSAATSLGIKEDALYLLVHTGSRGLGAAILAQETHSETNPYIPPGSSHLTEYLAEHDYAVRWAVANRDLVAYRIKQCLSAPLLRPDNHIDSDNDLEAASPQTYSPSVDLEKIIDVTHNSVTQHHLKVGEESRQLWVHRKGAAPVDKGIVPCPGSRGDFSWLLQATGDGQVNAHSLAHGAGCRYGRQVLHTGAKINKSSLTTTSLGSEVVCLDPDLLVEERPEAYRDVMCVVEDMEEKSICKGVAVLRPIVTYKVREAGVEARGCRDRKKIPGVEFFCEANW